MSDYHDGWYRLVDRKEYNANAKKMKTDLDSIPWIKHLKLDAKRARLGKFKWFSGRLEYWRPKWVHFQPAKLWIFRWAYIIKQVPIAISSIPNGNQRIYDPQHMEDAVKKWVELARNREGHDAGNTADREKGFDEHC